MQTANLETVIAAAERAMVASGIELIVSEDGMAVTARLARDSGLQPSDVLAALAARGVSQGILHEAIEVLCREHPETPVVVAKGRAPVVGQDTWFEHLVTAEGGDATEADGCPACLQPLLATSGMPLLRRHPATRGRAGVTVDGQALPARPGQDALMGPVGNGTAIDPNDPNLLLATRSGKVTYFAAGAVVEPLYVIGGTTKLRQKLRFDGHVIVQGPLPAGTVLTATGNVHVQGSLEDVTVEALGDVLVHGGVIGRNGCCITAGGMVGARFVETSVVEAGDSVFVTDHIVRSEVTALNAVIVKGGPRPQIAGGTVRATKLVQADYVGTPSESRTLIEVGDPPALAMRLRLAVETLQEKQLEVELLSRSLLQAKLFGRHTRQETIRALDAKRRHLLAEVALARDAYERLTALSDAALHCQVIVERKAFRGVQIRLAGLEREILQEVGGWCYRLDDERIVTKAV